MELRDLFINENITINEAVRKIQETEKKILLVTDGNKLKGVVTDGDVRRWILKNGNFEERVSFIMNTSPKVIQCEDKAYAKYIVKQSTLLAMPIVNSDNEVIDIVFWNDEYKGNLENTYKLENPVVIMAGGKGTRLLPYTKILPKPLIPIGDLTIAERIMNRYCEYGCNKFHLTINYKKNMVKAYFNELNETEKKYDINYIEEENPLGTAGSLSLLKGKISDTFFVNNCDILIDGDYSHMLSCHKKKKNKITLIASLKKYVIPYGVIDINENNMIKSILEKPEFNFMVNTGMYILESEVLDYIPKDTFYHITDLINDYMEKGENVGVYPIGEKEWLDMGQFKELEEMKRRLEIS